MDILTLLPEESSFSVAYPEFTRRGEGSILSAFNAQVRSKVYNVKASWLLTETEYYTFVTFFRRNEGKTFYVELPIDSPFPRPCEAKFRSNSFSFGDQSGDKYVVTCDLQCRTLPATF